MGRTYLGTVAWALSGVVLGQWRRSPLVAAAAAGGLVSVGVTLAASIPGTRGRSPGDGAADRR